MGSNWSYLVEFIRSQYNPNNDPVRNQQLEIQPYSYRLSFTDLQPGQTVSKVLSISAQADFILVSPRYRACVETDDDTLGDVVPKVLTLISDAGSNQQYSNDQVDISTYFGQIGRAPYDQQYPRIMNGRGAITLQITSYATSEVYSQIEFVFAGVLLKNYGQ